MKKILFIFLSILVATANLKAQTEIIRPTVGSIFLGLTITQPIGSFKKYYPNMVGLGSSFGFTVRPQAGYAPFELGSQIGYLPYGIEKHVVGTGSNAYGLKTTHSIIPFHALVRLKPRRTAPLNPYLDGLAGITIFNSRTKEKEDVLNALRDVDAVVITKHTATVFSYGLAVGLAFKIGGAKSIFGDIRLVYLEQPITRYVKKGDVEVDKFGNADYRFTPSETSLFLLQLNLMRVFIGRPLNY